MVRVLSCYHFRGQKIGRCDEAAAVTVAGQTFVTIAIEDNVNVYYTGHGFQSSDTDFSCDSGGGSSGGIHQSIPELGAPIVFGQTDKSPLSPGDDKRLDGEQPRSGSCSSSVSSVESDTEIKLSHTFSTVDLVRYLSYNRKGNYLLCLECRDSDGGASRCSSIRVYFHWDKKSDGQPMRTRIAGVSPSTNDLEKPGLTMVEIPLTSPAIAVASCTLSGHLASLSAESIVNIFSFRMKEVSGRGKMQYHDFDRLCAVEIPGFAPESLSFLGNFIACHGSGKIHVFQIQKADKSWSPSVIASDKYGVTKSKSHVSRVGFNTSKSGTSVGSKANSNFDYSNTVTYDPTDDSVTVHLPSVTRANRKRAGNTIVVEEYGCEILNNRSRIIFSSAVAGISVNDVLRLSFPQSNSASNAANHEKFSGTGLYPVRIKDKLGAVACVVGLTKEAMLFHLPTKDRNNPVRVANYNFTAPLVTFTFDSLLFLHALTESGLETYTSRSLYYALEDHEGFATYQNACPLKLERPCLVGIRPFVRVRFMAANESLICLLACPTPVESGTSLQSTTFSAPLSPSNPLLQDERLWTVYSLETPDIDMFYEDTMRLAESQEVGHSDSYFTLLCELYLILRAYINAVPEDIPYNTPRYQNLCKAIGLEYLKASWVMSACDSKESGSPGIMTQVNPSQNPFMSTSSEELLETAVTYLNMARLDIQHIFTSENSALTQDPQYIPGAVRLIDVLLSSYFDKDSADKHNFSPALSSSIVDFLSRHSPDTLVDLVIRIPFLRENHSTRLVEILKDFAQVRNYAGKEAVALILTFIAAGGVESNVRSQVQDVLSKVKTQDLGPCLRLEYILDRNAKQSHSALTDVAICLTAVNSDLPTVIISEAVKNQEVSVSEVMLAFAKAVNLNSESQIQRSLAKALRTILESFFSAKISNNNISDLSQNLSSSDVNTTSLHFTDDERHAVQALVRSYISDISLSPTNKFKSATAEAPFASENSQIVENLDSMDAEKPNSEKVQQSENDTFTPESVNGTEIMSRNQIFGKNPSFVNFLLSIEMPGGSITPANTTFSPTMFPNQESMESYIRLLSLLSSPLGKVEGVKDSVLSFVYNSSSSVKSTPLQLILQMFCEPVETAISILISRQPTTVLLYAKEMFGKSTSKWKMLVTQLKKRINLNPNTTDSDMFSTIIESVYLHLANTLSLNELEEVLEKGSDDVAKFRSTCKRVELANSYASMVIQISTDYLENKQ